MNSLVLINTKEWLRLKFFHVVLFLAFVYLFLSQLVGSLSFVEKERLILDFGLAGLEVTLFFVAAFLSTHALFKDIERKTIQVILARPIPRWHLLLGYLGSLAILNLIVVFVLGCFLALFLSDLNYIMSLFVTLFICWLKSLVIGSFGLLVGVLARPMFGFVLTVAYWLVAYAMPDIIYFSDKSKNKTLIMCTQVLDYITPQFYRFNWKDYHFIRTELNYPEIAWGILHCVGWIVLLLVLSSLFFKRKEIV